jgi:hypothetical protein
MKKLIVFGDSYTAGDPCDINSEYVIKHKKTENDIIWPELIARKLNLKLYNFGKGGSSNDTIFDSIIKNWETIDVGDIVIIGKSYYHRFDVPHPTLDRFETLNTWLIEKPMKTAFTQEEINHIVHTLILIDSPLNNKRQDMRFDFLKNMLIKQKKVENCIIWGIEDNCDFCLRNVCEHIIQETNGDIIDHHWSYNGHKTAAEWMLNKLI